MDVLFAEVHILNVMYGFIQKKMFFRDTAKKKLLKKK